MPLEKGSSKRVVSDNISEMRKSGYGEKQAVAASLSNARKSKRKSKRSKSRGGRK